MASILCLSSEAVRHQIPDAREQTAGEQYTFNCLLVASPVVSGGNFGILIWTDCWLGSARLIMLSPTWFQKEKEYGFWVWRYMLLPFSYCPEAVHGLNRRHGWIWKSREPFSDAVQGWRVWRRSNWPKVANPACQNLTGLQLNIGRFS